MFLCLSSLANIAETSENLDVSCNVFLFAHLCKTSLQKHLKIFMFCQTFSGLSSLENTAETSKNLQMFLQMYPCLPTFKNTVAETLENFCIFSQFSLYIWTGHMLFCVVLRAAQKGRQLGQFAPPPPSEILYKRV